MLDAARSRLIHNPPELRQCETVPYRQGFAIRVPSTSGVYLIHDVRGVLYVGQSKNLRRRFDQHFFEQGNPLLAVALMSPLGELSFSWQVLPKEAVDGVERRLIQAFHPLCNRRLYLGTSR